MTVLEQKVDAIARSLLANNITRRHAALAELEALMKKPYNPTDGVEEVTRQLLLELGMPEHLLGSRHLIKAICEVVKDGEKIKRIMDYVYPAVAAAYNTTPSRVGRTIRSAIEVAWDRGDVDVQLKYFGNTVSYTKSRPTNAEFIARCANIVRERMGGT